MDNEQIIQYLKKIQNIIWEYKVLILFLIIIFTNIYISANNKYLAKHFEECMVQYESYKNEKETIYFEDNTWQSSVKVEK